MIVEPLMPGLTQSLAEFVQAPQFGELPERAVGIIQTGFIDTIATMIAGRHEPVVDIVQRFVAARGSSAGEASLLGGTQRAASADAALINATAGHALDFDDVAMGGHPSTVLVPTVLAEAEALGLGGEQALNAYLVGYEVWSELFRREPDAYHLKGWHPTAVLGTLGAAAAAAHLRGLSVEHCRHALALAGSFAAGLVANFGSMTKPLHAGRAASAGIEAARLAQAGLTASVDTLEHHAGYLAALSPHGRADRDAPFARHGRTLGILDTGLSIKKYPICYATHRVIDAVIDMAAVHNLSSGSVGEVRAWIGVAQASMLRNHRPVTALEAKFSLEFAIASSLVARQVGLAELTDGFVNQTEVRALFERVTITPVDGERCPHEPVFGLNDRVEIELNDGRVLSSGDIRFARGNAMLPLAPEDLHLKFLDCTREAGDIDGPAVFDRLSNLRGVPRVATLFRS
jgi:2-methylcitrate dehydratase PrpD